MAWTGTAAVLENAGESRFYEPELDSLRFFAFALVFCHHAAPPMVETYVRHGFPSWLAQALVSVTHLGIVGVDLFFLLSGYLITALLLRERDQVGRVALRAFYVRRILRIWPVYFVSIAIAITWSVFDPLQVLPLKYLPWFLALAGNWAIVAYGIPGSIIMILWSISVEEQFYLCWPPLLSRLRSRHVQHVGVFLIIVSAISRWMVVPSIHDERLLFSTFSRMDSVAIGLILAARMHESKRRWSPSLAVRCALAFGGLLVWAPVGALESLGPAGLRVLFAVYPLVSAATLAIFLSVFNLTGQVARAVTVGPLIYLGRISYGLYAYHVCALWAAMRLLPPFPRGFGPIGIASEGFAITLTMAALSYRWMEKPLLRLRERFAVIQTRPLE